VKSTKACLTSIEAGRFYFPLNIARNVLWKEYTIVGVVFDILLSLFYMGFEIFCVIGIYLALHSK